MVLSKTRIWMLTISTTKLLPTAAFVSGGTDVRVGVRVGADPLEVAANRHVRGPGKDPERTLAGAQRLGVGLRVVGLGVEHRVAGDDQAVVTDALAADHRVVGTRGLGHEVADRGIEARRSAGTLCQDVARAVLDLEDQSADARECRDADGRALARVEVERVVIVRRRQLRQSACSAPCRRTRSAPGSWTGRATL